MTPFARFLDTTFYSFDHALFTFWRGLQCPFLTGLADFVSFFGKSGIMMIVLAVILLLFRKTRKAGLSVAIAMIIGTLLTNVILKNAVGRLRPYTRAEYQEWWQAVGGRVEGDLSFPSGHMTVITEAMLAIFFTSKNKKYAVLTFIPIALMAFARNYLFVHYATDVVAGVLVGTLSAFLGWLICKLIYKKIERSENKFSVFVLNADVGNLFKKKKRGN